MVSAVKTFLSVLMAAALIVSLMLTVFAETENESITTAVLLPCEVPFKIIVSNSGMQGMIYSDEFEVVNRGDDDVSIEIYAVSLQIEGDDGYYISDTEDLPESGSNIFIELLCTDEQGPSSIVLSDEPSEAAHTYHLKSGETGKFKFDGTVNEIDGPAWDDAIVQVHMCFSVIGADPVDFNEEPEDEAENDEDAILDDSNKDKALTPEQEPVASEQEPTTDANDTAEESDTTEQEHGNAQESQANTEISNGEPDQEIIELDNQNDEDSDADSEPLNDDESMVEEISESV